MCAVGSKKKQQENKQEGRLKAGNKSGVHSRRQLYSSTTIRQIALLPSFSNPRDAISILNISCLSGRKSCICEKVINNPMNKYK